MSDESLEATGFGTVTGTPTAADDAGVTSAIRTASLDPNSLGTVLLATDLGVTTREASRQAIVLAARLRSRLLIVHVLDARRAGPAPVVRSRPFAVRAERESDLLELVRRAHAAGVHAEFLLWEGDPAEAISAAASSEHADILVVGSRGRRGAERALLGSVSDELIRIASCPVMVVRPDLVTAEQDPAGR